VLGDTGMSGSREIFQQAMNKGHSAAWDQDWEQASVFYQQALDEIPDNPQALASMGLALFELHQYEEALKVYARAAAISGEDPIPFEKVSQLYERLDNPQNAIKAARRAADLYLKKRDSEKALANLVRVTRLNPEDLGVRSKLAMIYEGLGRKQQAVTEYIYIASNFQHAGEVDRAIQAVKHAISIYPESAEAHKALEQLQNSTPLPKPIRSKITTGELLRVEAKDSENSEETVKETNNLDPITEAQSNALTILAGLLFELDGDDVPSVSRKDPVIEGKSGFVVNEHLSQEDRKKTLLHLSQAVNLQTQGIIDKAAEELELAIESGIDHPAALFNLGLLRSKGQQIESALPILQKVVSHPDFALAAYLIRGNLFRKLDRINDAATEYLEALRRADSLVVDSKYSDNLWQSYEPLIASQANQADAIVQERLCDSISSILIQKDWKNQLHRVRQELSIRDRDSDQILLGEVLLEASSLEIIESISNVNQLVNEGHLRSAMEEAYFAMNFGPLYLPLHEQIGDLLLNQNRIDDALKKFTLIAKTYAVRGDKKHSTEILRRVLNLAPTDLDVRRILIEQLFEGGQVQEAVNESMELGEFYVNQAELRKARLTYSETLELAQRANTDVELIAQIFHRMADIDMQTLDWQQALQIFSNIKKIYPADEQARSYLIALNLRLGKESQALDELDDYIEYLRVNGDISTGINFVENILRENPDRLTIKQRLANLFGQAGRINDALMHYNAIGQAYLKIGNRGAAIKIVEQILGLNPPNRSEFERLLARLQNQ
jgi:tetratricopeptide (TPR) repeat protein